jgi:hypothetical protein
LFSYSYNLTRIWQTCVVHRSVGKLQANIGSTETEWREVSQEFERDGMRVRISGIPAMVYPNCGAVSYPAGIPNKLIEASNALFELVKD